MQKVSKRKRKTFEQQSVAAYLYPDETYAAGKKRLDEAWKQGKHPSQKPQ